MNKKALKKTRFIFLIIAVIFLILDSVLITNTLNEFKSIPAYQMSDQYDDIICEGDGYYLVRKYPYDHNNGTNYYNFYEYVEGESYGVIGPDGEWKIPMGQSNTITESMKIAKCGSFDYIGDGFFLFFRDESNSRIYIGCVINPEKNDSFNIGAFQNEEIHNYDKEEILSLAHNKYGW